MIAKKQNKIFFIQLNFDRMREVQTSKFQKYSKQLKTYRRQKKKYFEDHIHKNHTFYNL